MGIKEKIKFGMLKRIRAFYIWLSKKTCRMKEISPQDPAKYEQEMLAKARTKSTVIPGLICPKCHLGPICQVNERVGDLDVPHYLCLNCRTKWYESEHVVSLMALLKMKGE